MKTLDQKTEELVSLLMHLDLRTEQGIDSAETSIRRALKKQTSDTLKAVTIFIDKTNKGE